LIAVAVTFSRLESLLGKPVDREKNPQSIINLLEALKNYSILASRFDAPARDIARIFSLDKLEDPETWTLAAMEGRLPVTLRRAVDVVVEHVPRIVELFQPEALRHAERGDLTLGTAVLSVIVIEDKNRFSSPTRLVEVLQSVDELYEACAEIEGLPGSKLSVVSCDAGSDKAFDFLGAAKIIECVKELILSLWDRVVFFREKQLSQRIELIGNALPIMDRIGSLERDQKIGKEQAELLRRKILTGVGKFIESGAMIPEIQDRSSYNPRLLMAPEPKLLVSAPRDVVEDEKSDREHHEFQLNRNLEMLDEAERTQLLQLLQKAQSTRVDSEDTETADPEE